MTTSLPRHPAFLSLQGGINFRDLGGQRTADGRRVRSGKLLRRALQAVAEQRDPGDLTTMEDPTALNQVKELLATA